MATRTNIQGEWELQNKNEYVTSREPNSMM